MVAVEIVETFEDATESSDSHSIDIHNTGVAKVVDIWSYPTSICQLLKRVERVTTYFQYFLAPGGNLWPHGFPQ